MASNISKRLDRIERIANELLNQSNPPVYIRGDDPEPEGEYVRVVREYVTAPKRPDVTPLPLSELQAIYSALTLESRFGTSKSHSV